MSQPTSRAAIEARLDALAVELGPRVVWIDHEPFRARMDTAEERELIQQLRASAHVEG